MTEITEMPTTRHGQPRAVEATAWLAALELRRHRPEAALVADAIEMMATVLADVMVDRDGLHLRVAGFVARALRHYGCETSLTAMLEGIAVTETVAGAVGATRGAHAVHA